jgi:perosamine synthetase
MIPVNTPDLSGNEKKYLAECIDTGWISSEGPFIQRFESAMAGLTGRRHAVAVCNGSAALDVALQALELKPGDEVILPSFTIISCVLGILRLGAKPVVVDADPKTWNLDVTKVEDKITDRTRAVMAVHIYGMTVDMEPLLALAKRRGLMVVEDAAEAIGQTCRIGGAARPCGSFGDISVFSFYPNKHITTGEGGMVLTNDDRLAGRCRSIRNLCFGTGDERFHHEELGYNYRMCNLQAAVGCAQAERIEASVRRKREIGARYQEAFASLSSVELPCTRTSFAENIYWVFGMVLKDSMPFDAKTAMRRLAERGIGTRPFFWPLHEQPILRRMGLFPGARHPVAERLARRGFYIPGGLALSDAELDEVCRVVSDVLGK